MPPDRMNEHQEVDPGNVFLLSPDIIWNVFTFQSGEVLVVRRDFEIQAISVPHPNVVTSVF